MASDVETPVNEILVSGAAEVKAFPDKAAVTVIAEAEGPKRESAFEAASRLTKQIDEVLSRYEDATERVVTAELSIHPKTRWRKGMAVVIGWQATRRSVLEVRDLTCIGDLIGDLVAAGATVDGLSWQLDLDNPAYTDIRRRAAEDARRRADAYASALDLQIVGVSWVAEPGLRVGGEDRGIVPAGGAPRLFRRFSGNDDDEGDLIDLNPDEIRVSAEVEVGFRYH